MAPMTTSAHDAHRSWRKFLRPRCLRKQAPRAESNSPERVPSSDAPVLLNRKKPPLRSFEEIKPGREQLAAPEDVGAFFPAPAAEAPPEVCPEPVEEGVRYESIPGTPTVVSAPGLQASSGPFAGLLRSQLFRGERSVTNLEALFEMSSIDSLCVRTINVSFTDLAGVRRHVEQSGYNVKVILPSSASNIEVTFSTVGDYPVLQVDRSSPDMPWKHGYDGEIVHEKFRYATSPEHVQYFLRGPTRHCWVAQVDERERTQSLLELISRDLACIRTMHVSYSVAGQRQQWSGSGYNVKCHLPSASKDVEVTFSVVGGAKVSKVDRRDPQMPWVQDANGQHPLERFSYPKCPTCVQYEIRGPSLHNYIAQVRQQNVRTGSSSSRGLSSSQSCVIFSGDPRSMFEVEPDKVPAIGGIVELKEPHSEYLLPQEVVLFEPSKKEIFARGDDSRVGGRQIFLNTPLMERETAALAELHRHLVKKGVVSSENSAFPRYMELHALRMLQTCKFNIAKAADMMKVFSKERVRRLPIAEADVLPDLHSGFIYWHGRDKMCRPCLHIRLERIGEMAHDKERAVRTVIFTLEYALRFAMVPGRVENWVVIIDLANVFSVISPLSIGSMISTASAIGTTLEKVYCGRMVWIKIVNMLGGAMLSRAVNGVIPAEKKDKVSFPKDAAAELAPLFEPNQLERRYGGNQPDLQPGETYPFRFFPKPRGEAARSALHEREAESESETAETASGSPRSSSLEPEDYSLHDSTDLALHEGSLWDDSSAEAHARWVEVAKITSLAPEAATAMAELGIDVDPCRDINRWTEIVNPSAVHLEFTKRANSVGSDADLKKVLVNSVGPVEIMKASATVSL